MYDFGKPRGFYAIGGVGYGLRVKLRGNLQDLSYLASVVDSGKTPEQLMADPRFQSTINSLANNPSGLVNFINQVLPGNEHLTSQVDSRDKIENLLKNETALNNFINDAQNVGFDSGAVIPSSVDAICNILITCDKGIAYTLGVGYDLPIWGPLGLDFQAKSRFMNHTSPIYSAGANIIFRW
jgi:hypothetical protein